MGLLTRTQMNSAVAAIIDRSDQTTAINTRLQWAMDEIAGMYPWRSLVGEDTSITLNPSDKSYTIPSTYRIVTTIRYVSDYSGTAWMLWPLDQDEFDEKFPYAESEAESAPRYWTRKGSNIIVHPIPGTGQCSLVTGTDTNSYYCIANHTAAAATCPITGASYETYWSLSSSDDDASTWASGTDYFCDKLYMNGIKWATAFSGDSSTSDLDKPLDQAIVYLAAAMIFEMIEEENKAQYWSAKGKQIADRTWDTEQGMNEV